MNGGIAVARLSAMICVLGVAMTACSAQDDSTPAVSSDGIPASAQRPTLRAIALPDLSRAAVSVQQQLRERFSSLMEKTQNAGASPNERGNAYGELGTLFMAGDYLDVAESCYLNAQMLAPGDMRWPYYLGHVYRNSGDLAQSAAFFERSLQLRPADPTTLVHLGAVYLDQGRPEAAEPVFTSALSLEPASAAAMYGLGRTALAKKDYARAVSYLEQALSRNPRASRIHYPLALAYRGLGKLDIAEAHVRQQGDGEISTPDPLMEHMSGLLESAMAFQSRGIRALEQGRWEPAVAYFRRAIELEPRTASLRQRLGTALFMTGDAQGASDQFEEALRLSPTFSRAQYSLGVLLASRGRYQEALDLFSAAVKHEPDYGEARLALADTLRGFGRSEEALRQYEQILTMDPRVADARLGQAMTLVSLGRYQPARQRLAEAVQAHPDQPRFTVALARVLAAAPDDRVRDGRRALEEIQKLSQEPPGTELMETIAMVLAELGQYEEAAARQKEAIAAATRAGDEDLARRMTSNLRLYESRRPCRAPWRDGELP